jgi:hypothetical protein
MAHEHARQGDAGGVARATHVGGWASRAVALSDRFLSTDCLKSTSEGGQQACTGMAAKGNPDEDWCSGLESCVDPRDVVERTQSGRAWPRCGRC